MPQPLGGLAKGQRCDRLISEEPIPREGRTSIGNTQVPTSGPLAGPGKLPGSSRKAAAFARFPRS